VQHENIDSAQRNPVYKPTETGLSMPKITWFMGEPAGAIAMVWIKEEARKASGGSQPAGGWRVVGIF
jgi:hypothetical protein